MSALASGALDTLQQEAHAGLSSQNPPAGPATELRAAIEHAISGGDDP
jgi:hypothetical protein